MFDQVRSLVLRDRDAARKALAAEIEAQTQAGLDEELDEIEREERERLAREESERAAADARDTAARDLREVRERQHELAAAFDAALAAAEQAFLDLEALGDEVARLERLSGQGAGDRATVVAHARSTAIVAAVWNSARGLAKRLGLRRVPSGPLNARPLTDTYKSPKEE